MGLLEASDWKGRWINDGKPLPEKDADFYRDDPAPLFRREFKLSGPVRSARLYISVLGYVYATLNGRAVGDHHLDPLWALPNKRVFYSVNDVSKNLAQSDNCLGVTLGNGWYNPLPLRMWGRVNLRERLPVGRPRFIAQLLIEYTDDSRESLASDSAWKVAPGPILRNSIYLGEKFDARKAVKVTASVKPVSITEPSDGVYIVDMGRNSGGAQTKTMTVSAEEFTRRFLQHMLPAGVHKVRYYGLWSPTRRKNLHKTQQTFIQSGNDQQVRIQEDTDLETSPSSEPRKCRHCQKGTLIRIRRLPRQGRAPP